jgi:amino acid adenylation domain-containing protein
MSTRISSTKKRDPAEDCDLHLKHHQRGNMLGRIRNEVSQAGSVDNLWPCRRSLQMSDSEPSTLYDLFRTTAKRHGSRPAIWVDGCLFSYAELDESANRLAGAIIATRGNLQQGQCALLVDRTPTAYVGVLGSLIAGLAYVPINPRLPRDRMVDLVRLSESDLIVVDDRCLATAEHILGLCSRPLTVLLPDCNRPPLWTSGLARHRFLCRSDIERAAPPDASGPSYTKGGAYLLFTSGSTGMPKGVPIDHANALAYIRNVSERYRPSPEDRFTQCFDLSFDLSVHDMFLCWSSGACLYCVPHAAKSSPRNFIRRHELTFWFSVPSTAAFMSRMHMLRPDEFPTLRWSLFCGEALPTGLAREWQRAAPHSIVENLYGPTETTVAFTAYRLPDFGKTEYDIVPIGWPFQGQQIAVIDPKGRILPDGEIGELCLGGSQVAKGYWHLPEATAETFVPPRGASTSVRWYRTGDLVRNTMKDGLLFHGRTDRQVKIRGHRIELQEIEAVIRSASGTQLVAVVPWPAMADGLPLGVVGLISGSQVKMSAVLEECRKKLPEYMIPSELHDLPAWPLNPNAKTDYRALRSILEKLSCRN